MRIEHTKGGIKTRGKEKREESNNAASCFHHLCLPACVRERDFYSTTTGSLLLAAISVACRRRRHFHFLSCLQTISIKAFFLYSPSVRYTWLLSLSPWSISNRSECCWDQSPFLCVGFSRPSMASCMCACVRLCLAASSSATQGRTEGGWILWCCCLAAALGSSNCLHAHVPGWNDVLQLNCGCLCCCCRCEEHSSPTAAAATVE